MWFRMVRVAVRLAWPYLLTPWRSPLLRWRMETYGILDERGVPLNANAIDAKTFMRFVLTRRAALLQFLRWAASLEAEAVSRRAVDRRRRL
jgi:hypothetical protein